MQRVQKVVHESNAGAMHMEGRDPNVKLQKDQHNVHETRPIQCT